MPSICGVLMAVLCLFLTRSPTTVVRLVVAVIVDAFECVSLPRSFSKISEEAGEGIGPLLTDGDTTTSIAGIVRGVRIQAAVLHRLPGNIGQRAKLAVLSDLFEMQTTATLLFARTKILPLSNTGFAAPTLAKPGDLTSSIPVSFKDKQSSKVSASQVNESPTTCSHC